MDWLHHLCRRARHPGLAPCRDVWRWSFLHPPQRLYLRLPHAPNDFLAYGQVLMLPKFFRKPSSLLSPYEISI
jgi:hypothetical protein